MGHIAIGVEFGGILGKRGIAAYGMISAQLSLHVSAWVRIKFWRVEKKRSGLVALHWNWRCGEHWHSTLMEGLGLLGKYPSVFPSADIDCEFLRPSNSERR